MFSANFLDYHSADGFVNPCPDGYNTLIMIRAFRLVFLVLALGAAAFCGRSSGKDYSDILKRNIFAAPVPAPPPETKVSILRPLPPPPLDSLVEVKGIIHLAEGDSRVLLLRRKTGVEAGYREGDTIETAEILRINKDSILFRYADKNVVMNLDGSLAATTSGSISSEDGSIRVVPTPGKPGTGTGSVEGPAPPLPTSVPEASAPVPVNLHETLDALQSDARLLQEVNVTPFIQSGKVEGFTIRNLPEDSVPYRYGLRNGDIVRRINGVLIDSLSRALILYRQVQASQSGLATVEVLRNGTPVLLTYRLQ